MNVEIIPAIIARTQEEIVEKIMAVEPYVERVHLDIADGIFVSNMTFDRAEALNEIKTSLKIEAHLMVSKPENHVARWLETPVDKIIFHAEATQKAQMIIAAMREAGEQEVGIALNPQTPVSAIDPLLDLVDFVHFMTVEPGFYGGQFVPAVVDKIKDFHYFYPDKPISVDGGVAPDTVPQLVAAGASRLVAGSYIFESKDIAKSINDLREL